MNSFMYLLSDKFFAAKLRISKAERHKANSPHEYFVWQHYHANMKQTSFYAELRNNTLKISNLRLTSFILIASLK